MKSMAADNLTTICFLALKYDQMLNNYLPDIGKWLETRMTKYVSHKRLWQTAFHTQLKAVEARGKGVGIPLCGLYR